MNKKDNKHLQELTRLVMAKLKVRYPSLELHHIFGRIGRFACCQSFIAPLTPDEHRGKGYGYRLERIRDKFRNAYLEMKAANRKNKDQTKCWWSRCWNKGECPLYEKQEV